MLAKFEELNIGFYSQASPIFFDALPIETIEKYRTILPAGSSLLGVPSSVHDLL
jgi:hypothetical protein